MDKKKVFRMRRWILPFMALMVFGLTQVLIRYPDIAERYYSQQIYPVLASTLSFISRWFSVSLDDLFYLMLIISGVVIIGMLIIRKISLKTTVLIVLNVLAGLYIGFYLLWGFNYFRADLNTRLEISTRLTGPSEFMKVFSYLVESTNDSYTTYDEFDEAAIAALIEDSYRQLAPVLKLNYPAGTRRPKNITLSGFFAQAGISGYFGPYFNEVHVNKKILPVDYPFVLAHEKAHQFGITSEAEANFYAWLVCKNSESQQLQYSANLIAVRYFLYYGRDHEGYKEVISKLDERVIDDIKRVQQHWMLLRNEKVEAIASKVNDAYLKTNQVEKGIRDYTGIVKHILEFSLDSSFQKKAGF
jgi:hypothetical protein